jgi:AraC-like DNA-binding protein
MTNILFIITGLIGLITIIAVLINFKSNRIMNFYIILLIFIISIRFFLSGFILSMTDLSYRYLYFIYSDLSIVVIPICYLYFKNLFTDEKAFNSKELLHFIFPLSFFLLRIILNDRNSQMTQFSIVLYIAFFAYVSLYNILSYRILKNKVWMGKDKVKIVLKQNKLIYNWTLFLFIAFLLISIRLLVTVFIEVYYNNPNKGNSYQWISSIIWLLISFKILISPEVLYGYNALYKKLNINTSFNLNNVWNLSSNIKKNNSQHKILKEKIDVKLLFYIKEIEKISLEYELFRNPKMTTADLANKLNIPKSHISYLFKYHSTVSFTEFKKMVRILDATKQIELDYLKMNTLDSLSKKVGFTSYNPFFTSFIEIAGVSPLEYCKQIKKVQLCS